MLEITVKDLIEALKQSPEECVVKCCCREFCNPAEARIVAVETSHSVNTAVLIVFKDLKRMV